MYIELHTRSVLSLLGGASLPEHLVERAAELEYPAIALTDEMDMGGVIRFAERAQELGIGGILGAQMVLDWAELVKEVAGSAVHPHQRDSTVRVVLLAESERGYRNICRLITRARLGCSRDRPRVKPSWLREHLDGVVVLDGGFDGPLGRALRAKDDQLAEVLGKWLVNIVPRGSLFFELYDHRLHEERRLTAQIDALGERLKVPRLVTGDVRFATRGEKAVYDLLTCVRHRTRLSEAGTRLLPNAEWHLQRPDELWARWKQRPELLRETLSLGERLAFRFERLTPRLPHFPIPDRFDSDGGFLAHLTWEGAHLRYGELTSVHRRQIQHELNVIGARKMEGYFLISWDIARFCRERGILAQGRGSAANSAVCYCLQITAIDPIGMEMLFERFLSEGREDYPDIDIDIAHEWREEAIQYVYQRYGRERAALVCEQIRYRHKSAVRDVAWALGFEQDQIDRLASQFKRYRDVERGGDWLKAQGAKAAGVHSTDPRLPLLGSLVDGLYGIPRHRSIHVGGMVLTAGPLCEIVPIEPASMPDRTVIQWEKDDLPYSNLAKFDLLGLGMLSLLQKALTTLSEDLEKPFDLASIPYDDKKVYDSVCGADTVGVFQIESRAQMNTLPRLKPRRFYDLVVEIALIRPGPIQGQMVHPYLRRRNGEEPITYLHPTLKPILERTLGVPIFQEQVMRIAIELAGFSPSQADELRRAMGFRRYSPRMDKLRVELDKGMKQKGIGVEVREQIIVFLTAFGNYGFPESHSASFALLAYASAWLKVHHAPLFTACLINSQPMGFYSNATIVQDARQRGVEIRPPALQKSDWDCTLEPAENSTPWRHALRIGLRCITGLGKKARVLLETARAMGTFNSIRDVVVRTGLSQKALATLAQAGAFDSFLGKEVSPKRRRQALWSVLRESRIPASGLDRHGGAEQGEVNFEPLTRAEIIGHDYRYVGLSAEGHPMEILRPELSRRGILSAQELKSAPDDHWVRLAGLVLVRQRPGTAKGFVFISLEDETGISNVIVTPQLFKRYQEVILLNPILEIHGIAQNQSGAVQVRGRHFYGLDGFGSPIQARNFH